MRKMDNREKLCDIYARLDDAQRELKKAQDLVKSAMHLVQSEEITIHQVLIMIANMVPDEEEQDRTA
jgi:hypothetical protein